MNPLLLLGVAALGLLALAKKRKPAAEPGLPNPASAYCVEQGGTLQGEICTFPGGGTAEQWALYRHGYASGWAQKGTGAPESYAEQVPWFVKRDADGNWGYQVDFAETQYEGWPVSTAGEAFSQLAAFLSTNFYAFLPYGTQPTAAGTGPANPAAAYCLAQGGALDLRTDEQGGQYSVCMFPDGREVEAWAFYRGEAEPELPGPGLQSLPAPSGEYQIGVGRRTPGKQRFAYLRARGMR